MKNTLTLLPAIIASGAFLCSCKVEKTEEGKLPDVEVDVDTEKGNLPKYDVDAPEVDVNKKKVEVTVPDVDVTMPDEKPDENE
ncbi:hypothetical protein JIN77_04430 [Verrucomicrobiaceae bacterium R5-34]|uniref:Uncharacterized protein n=1 Tax=Oceaniferula flava TaxID=2800421 RepID=A0AAE2V895_9BACT|nr:hypothetical protein [Oceaniferula flavus]MBK1829960.1 hypothetical protein [Verrucomicrobiaceae bacterium R5-34]MBK1855192.1 hypothetical protein [Oceaniferula flavus]MBM1136498.1 hypothetical protein [Oceaniferula flavus]